MAYFRCYNADGSLQFSADNRLAKVTGRYSISQSQSGSFSTGIDTSRYDIWFYCSSVYGNFLNPPPRVWVEGDQIRFEYSNDYSSYPLAGTWVIVWGVY